MPSDRGDRYYSVGETVVAAMRVSRPGTRTPADATVTMVKAQRIGDPAPVVSDDAFDREAEGDYAWRQPTDGWPPGTYNVVVRVAGPNGVVLVRDHFVLQPA